MSEAQPVRDTYPGSSIKHGAAVGLENDLANQANLFDLPSVRLPIKASQKDYNCNLQATQLSQLNVTGTLGFV